MHCTNVYPEVNCTAGGCAKIPVSDDAVANVHALEIRIEITYLSTKSYGTCAVCHVCIRNLYGHVCAAHRCASAVTVCNKSPGKNRTFPPGYSSPSPAKYKLWKFLYPSCTETSSSAPNKLRTCTGFGILTYLWCSIGCYVTLYIIYRPCVIPGI